MWCVSGLKSFSHSFIPPGNKPFRWHRSKQLRWTRTVRSEIGRQGPRSEVPRDLRSQVGGAGAWQVRILVMGSSWDITSIHGKRCRKAPLSRPGTQRRNTGLAPPRWPTTCALRHRRRSRVTLQGAFLLRAKAIGMTKPVVTPVPAAKTLAEQKSDFTAEGSPPPGKVSTSTPVSSPDPKRASPTQLPARATITLKRVAARSNP